MLFSISWSADMGGWAFGSVGGAIVARFVQSRHFDGAIVARLWRDDRNRATARIWVILASNGKKAVLI